MTLSVLLRGSSGGEWINRHTAFYYIWAPKTPDVTFLRCQWFCPLLSSPDNIFGWPLANLSKGLEQLFYRLCFSPKCSSYMVEVKCEGAECASVLLRARNKIFPNGRFPLQVSSLEKNETWYPPIPVFLAFCLLVLSTEACICGCVKTVPVHEKRTGLRERGVK